MPAPAPAFFLREGDPLDDRLLALRPEDRLDDRQDVERYVDARRRRRLDVHVEDDTAVLGSSREVEEAGAVGAAAIDVTLEASYGS